MTIDVNKLKELIHAYMNQDVLNSELPDGYFLTEIIDTITVETENKEVILNPQIEAIPEITNISNNLKVILEEDLMDGDTSDGEVLDSLLNLLTVSNSETSEHEVNNTLEKFLTK